MPGSQPTVEIAVLDQGMPTSGSRSQAASTASRFMSGSPMPMNTAFVTALRAAEVERLVEDLGGREVAAEAHPAGRAEGAGQRAARLARQAERAAPVAVAHQHRLERARVVRAGTAPSRVPSEATASRSSSSERERHLAPTAAARSSSGRFVMSSYDCAPRAAHSHTWRARKPRLAARAQALVEQLQVHGAESGSLGRMRLGKFLAHAGVASRRAAEQLVAERPRAGGRRGGHRSRPRRGRAERRDGGRPRGRGRAARGARAQQAGRRGVHRPATPTGARRWWSWCARTGASIRSGASTPTPPA